MTVLQNAVQDFCDAQVGVVSEANQKWYCPRLDSLINALGADTDVDSIATRDLRAWRTGLVKRKRRWVDHPCHPAEPGGLSPATLRGYVRAIRTLFNWMEAEGLIDHNPARRLRLPPKPKTPARDIAQADALAILEAARTSARDYALLRFLADTGCRVSGVVNLTLGCLHLKDDNGRGRYATVREKGRGGELKTRTVYLSAVTAQALRAYLDQRPESEDSSRVFLSQRPGASGQPLGKSGVYQMLARYARDLQIEGPWNPHAWRHAFAHGLLDNGADLSLVAQLMGHEDVRTTAEAYGQRADRVLADHHRSHSWLRQHDAGASEKDT